MNFSCAIAKKSGKYQNKNIKMHEMLLKAEVFVCETMWTELTVETTTLRSERAVVRIDETSDRLQIYVPSDPEGLYSCYCTELPIELAKALGIDDRGASKVIYRIINDQVKNLETIMRDEDLSQFSWIPRPATAPRQIPISPPRQDLVADQPSGVPQQNGATEEEGDIFVMPSGGVHAQSTSESSDVPEPGFRNEYVAPLQTPWQRVARSELYRKLLQSVIEQGRRTRGQTQDPFSLSQLGHALNDSGITVDHDELGREFSFIPPQERALIGAAGELFVRVSRWHFIRISILTSVNRSSSNCVPYALTASRAATGRVQCDTT
jgi:hypothetical protein